MGVNNSRFFYLNLNKMCFSAGASFSAGLVLAVIGIATIKKASNNSQLIFASIPLIFSIQQIVEGILWLTIGNIEFVFFEQIATYVFLLFAQVLWPILVPISIFYLSKNDSYKLIQRILIGVGIAVSFYLLLCIIYYDVSSEIIEQHIVYHQGSPKFLIGNLPAFFYVVATILPPFFTKIKHVWYLGLINLIASSISYLFYTHFLVSIWCFFASLMSISVWFILYELNKTKQYRLSEL